MNDRDALRERIERRRVRLQPKADSPLMRGIGALLRLTGNRTFMESYWTTLARTIYYPQSVGDPLDHAGTLEHELVHVGQWERWSVLLWLSYLLFPLPVGLAWFRWRWEREAYLVQLDRAPDPRREIEPIVAALWSGYAWPWPRPWMRRWFENAVAARGVQAGTGPRSRH